MLEIKVTCISLDKIVLLDLLSIRINSNSTERGML